MTTEEREITHQRYGFHARSSLVNFPRTHPLQRGGLPYPRSEEPRRATNGPRIGWTALKTAMELHGPKRLIVCRLGYRRLASWCFRTFPSPLASAFGVNRPEVRDPKRPYLGGERVTISLEGEMARRKWRKKEGREEERGRTREGRRTVSITVAKEDGGEGELRMASMGKDVKMMVMKR